MCACVRLYCGECVGDNKSQSRRRVHCARACSSAKPSCSVLRTFFRKACTFHKKTISTAGGGFNMMMSKSVDVPRYFNMLILQLDYVSFVLNIFKCLICEIIVVNFREQPIITRTLYFFISLCPPFRFSFLFFELPLIYDIFVVSFVDQIINIFINTFMIFFKGFSSSSVTTLSFPWVDDYRFYKPCKFLRVRIIIIEQLINS